MSGLDDARATHIKNIEVKTGKTLAELRQIIEQSGLTKHSDIRKMLQEKFGLGYGDANGLVHYALSSDGQSAAEASGTSLDAITDEIYSGKKENLRPIHDAVISQINEFGEFETVPKKGYLSLRRKKQFAMLGPASKGRVEVGLNMKGVQGTERLQEMSPGGMCQYKVFLADPAEVDAELVSWIRQAYDSAG
jgi:hypothetical protein